MMMPWMFPQGARPPVQNLGLGGMTPQMLSQVGNANVGPIKGLPDLTGKPNMNLRNAMLGMGMSMLNNRNQPPGQGGMFQQLPMIMQMLQARRGR